MNVSTPTIKVTKEIGTDSVAKVYVAELQKGTIEFAESVQPGIPREEKWVNIVSCLVGCPARCKMCDAGKEYRGPLTKGEILDQVDFLVKKRFGGTHVPVRKWKVQFTRMGEPAYNPAVLEVLEELPEIYDAPGLLPSVSTIDPKGCDAFFSRLKDIKNRLYSDGMFQLQFSIHTTDEKKRDELIPVPKMSFKEIASYGESFFSEGDRKITLNFVVMEEYPIELDVLKKFFDPSLFIIKLTPLNPTRNAEENTLKGLLDPHDEKSVSVLVEELKSSGYDVIVSIGDLEENQIGSNCGMFVSGDSEDSKESEEFEEYSSV